jgi:transcriptional regulator with XRE-family HTH domain
MLINAGVVRNRRSARGWTQQQLADVTGLSLRTVQRVEANGNGSHETVAALCAVLEVERDTLLREAVAASQALTHRWLGGAMAGLLGAIAGSAATYFVMRFVG